MRGPAILLAFGIASLGCAEMVDEPTSSSGTSGSLLIGVTGGGSTTSGTTGAQGGGTTTSGTTGGEASTGGTTTGEATTGGTTGADAGLPCCHGTVSGQGGTNGGAGGWTPDPGQDPGVNCSCVDTCQNACGWGTPLVLSLLESPVEFTEPSGYFELLGGSEPRQTDWVAAGTPWLCLDRDGDGRIDDGSELFGSMTRLDDGRRALNGFEALRALDRDGDGFLTAADPAWQRLLLWSDRNQDRIAQPDELVPLSATPVLAIALDYRSVPRCDARGNCEIERATVYYAGVDHTAVGSMVDVHLPSRPLVAQARRPPR
jgi:hypothetical protein